MTWAVFVDYCQKLQKGVRGRPKLAEFRQLEGVGSQCKRNPDSKDFLAFSSRSLTCTCKPLLTAGGLLLGALVSWQLSDSILAGFLLSEVRWPENSVVFVIFCMTFFLMRMLLNTLRKFIRDALVSGVMMDSFPPLWPYWLKWRERESDGEENLGVVCVFRLKYVIDH